VHLVKHLMVAVVITTACSIAGADSYVPELLFTLAYGKADNQIGVWVPEAPGEAGGGPPAGPTGIAVGPDESVYIADRVNDCIKRFDQYGALAMQTEGELDNIQDMAVDSAGSVYALGGAGVDLLAKFGADGQLLWRKHLGDAIPVDVWRPFGGAYGDITIGPEDTICVRLHGGRASALAVLDGNGTFLRIYDARAYTVSGTLISVARVPGERLASQVSVRDSEGRLLASYVANPVSGDPSLFEGAAPGLSWRYFDAADHMYTVVHASRGYVIPLSAELRIPTDVVVTRHGPDGQPLAYLRLPSFPFMTGRDLTVDADGNVYHLAYGDAAVSVVRYRLEESPKTYALRGLVSISRAGTRYVPLRLVADYTGAQVRWDSHTKQAILLRGAAGTEKPRSIKLAVGEEGLLLYRGRLWISFAACQDRLGLALSTDRKHQLAYLQSEGQRASRGACIPADEQWACAR